jgi:6-phosphogluconolactonase
MQREMHLFDNGDELAAFAERLVRRHITNVLARGECCSVALSGGATPRPVYARLARADAGPAIDWRRVFLFWGDERCVRPGDHRSNYTMARASLIAGIDVPPGNMLRMRGELGAAAGARAYEAALRLFFAGSQRQTDRGYPAFDLVLLGMGSDGHTASLFPHARELAEPLRWVVPVTAPRGISPAERVTLTLPAIAAADTVIFLVAGEGKRQLARDIACGRIPPGARYPASMVTARRRLVWCIAP